MGGQVRIGLIYVSWPQNFISNYINHETSVESLSLTYYVPIRVDSVLR